MTCHPFPLRPSVRARRRLATVLALTSLGALGGPLPSGATAAAPAPAPAGPAVDVRLQADAGSVVRAASVRIGRKAATGRLHRPAHGAGQRTARLDTSTFSMVAVTWRGKAPGIRVRTHTDGRWTGWRRLAELADLPDVATAEGNGRRGTEPLWVGASDGVQVSVLGARPAGLHVELIDPGSLPSDAAGGGSAGAASTSGASSARAAAPAKRAPQPALKYRADWGADESWRNGAPHYGRTIQQVHVHHTATGNSYTWADVPGLIRGMYRYHTHTLGWSDIGYNFLVDRFGRIWVGRFGGVGRPVRGAHTLGFNETSVGVSVIGNYETARPSAPALTALVHLAAWKLDKYARRPQGWARVYSHGSDLFPRGKWVVRRVLDGHRDTNQTACPGKYLYRELPTIRERAQRRVERY